MNGSQELSQPQNYAPTVNRNTGVKKQKGRLSYETANEYLRYDPETGLLHRKKHSRGQKYESPTHLNSCNGYLRINCEGRLYQAHRVIWLLHHGYWPENLIDHINNNRSDNRIINLREVSNTCNIRNCPVQKNSTSGITGVSPSKQYKRWEVYIKVNYKRFNLGFFKDFDEAVCHRLAAEQCLDWSTCRAETPAAAYVKRMLNP